jgi:VWFA-related protein
MMRPTFAAIVAATMCLCTPDLSGPAEAQEQPPARFRSSADAVRVDVQVRQGNRPVAGLQAKDFELRDSKVVQDIQAVAIEDVPVSLFLALDTSSSVRGKLLDQLKAAAHAAVGALRDDDQAALFTFSQRISRPAALTRDRQVIKAAIDRMAAEGSTALRDAIFAATVLREQAPGRVILLVFTDGLDTTSWLDTKSVVEAALRSDMVIYAVSTGSRMMEHQKSWYEDEPELFPGPFLADLTDRTGGELLQVKAGAELAKTFAKIVSDFKSRYLLTYAPRNVPAGGWHPIEVKLKNRRGDVTARRGYWR